MKETMYKEDCASLYIDILTDFGNCNKLEKATRIRLFLRAKFHIGYEAVIRPQMLCWCFIDFSVFSISQCRLPSFY